MRVQFSSSGFIMHSRIFTSFTSVLDYWRVVHLKSLTIIAKSWVIREGGGWARRDNIELGPFKRKAVTIVRLQRNAQRSRGL